MESINDYTSKNEDYGRIMHYKPDDVTMKIDLVAEYALQRSLIDHDICVRIVSEELGDRIFPPSEVPGGTIVFDPVDGTRNLVRGIPFFCTSLAYSPRVEHATFDDIEIGVVIGASGKVYHGVKNRGAYVNGDRMPRRMRVGKPMISVYSYGISSVPDGIAKLERRVAVRTLGSIATELCMVAEGTIDAVIGLRNYLSGYDIAASFLIIKETGGRVTNIRGEEIKAEVDARSLPIVCTMLPHLHDAIIGLLNY
jgi:myo-inositol-1(or 4)-monophosphatase